MPARLAQQEDENESPPTEGKAAGQGWVLSWESFPYSGPTPFVRQLTDVHPSVGGDFLARGFGCTGYLIMSPNCREIVLAWSYCGNFALLFDRRGKSWNFLVSPLPAQ